MTGHARATPIRVGLALFVALAAVSALTLGSTLASGAASRQTTLPCRDGGGSCLNIGFTDAWLEGATVQLGYSHAFFCRQPPTSGAVSHCEAGEEAGIAPPNLVVSEIYELVPLGFSPPGSTLHCPIPGRCIDHPQTIDLSRVLGWGTANATFPRHSIVLEEDESFQSTWWPLVLIGVKNLQAWNAIATAKSIGAVEACQDAGNCTPDVDTNAFIFFQVLGPGMSPEGPD
jgi:hypothetical protein